MSTVFLENSVWLEWVRTAAQLVYSSRFPLTEGGPRQRRAANAQLLDECNIVSPDVRPESACWWDIQVFGWTATTVVNTPAAPTLQDPRVNGNRNVPLLGTLRYLGDEIIFDVGAGAHFSVYAPSVSLGVLAPTGTFLVGPTGQTNFPAAGPVAPVNVTSAQVNGSVAACAPPSTSPELKLTQTIAVEAASVDIAVPARARTLQIFQESATLPAAPLNWLSDATTAFDLGEVDFDTPTAPARTAVLEVPGLATILRTNAGGRTLTLVWGLRP